ncbi:zinc finger protein 239-like [Physella acuta]|uniref:zinc finger protein 239-like n=1 Tax=Physella acuta TaxID=109671 RepID=UPI0027DD79EB|nr:zinc finger protein 239-like [Physella acuta]
MPETWVLIEVQSVDVSKSSLTNMENNEGDTYQCQHCRVAFTKLAYLNKHLRYRHGGGGITNGAPDLIGDAGELSSQSNNFPQHRIMCMAETPYTCDVCGKCFTQLRDFQTHLRIFTEEKHYYCVQCGECFQQYHAVQNHFRWHTEENHYNCGKCCKQSTRKPPLFSKHPVHPIIAETRGNCKLCYLTDKTIRRTFVKCSVCDNFLCFVKGRNCLAKYHVL